MRIQISSFLIRYIAFSIMASNASGYPEALCLLGKIFPKPHFRMTSHAAARTLRCAFSRRKNAINALFSSLSAVLFLFPRRQVSVPHWHAPSATAAFHPAPDDMLHTPAFSSLSARHTQLESLLPSVSFVYQVPRKPPLPPDAA